MEPIATGCCGGQNCKWVQRETSSRRIELTKPIKYEGSDTSSGLGKPWNFHCWKLGEYSRIHFPCSYFLLSHSLYWPVSGRYLAQCLPLWKTLLVLYFGRLPFAFGMSLFQSWNLFCLFGTLFLSSWGCENSRYSNITSLQNMRLNKRWDF